MIASSPADIQLKQYRIGYGTPAGDAGLLEPCMMKKLFRLQSLDLLMLKLNLECTLY